MNAASPLISADALQTQLQSTHPPLVLDVSYDLLQPDAGRAMFAELRISGAQHVDLSRDLSAAAGAPTACGGRHPLPTREDFAQWLGSRGITAETAIVAYDRNGTMFAGRLWWMLRWCGHTHVQLLDGGLPAWQAVGGELAQGESHWSPKPATYALGLPQTRLVTLDEVAAGWPSRQHRLVDARAAARYRGDTEPLDPVAGHVPGALNRPFDQNFNDQGQFKDAATLRAEWHALLGEGATDAVVLMCGSGVSAVPNLLAMELAGLRHGGLFAGSWSEWCRQANAPCATGDAPG